MEDTYTDIGRIVRPHGVRGMLKVRIREDLPDIYYQATHLHIQKDTTSPLESYEVERFQKMKPLYALLSIKGVTSYESANHYREANIFSVVQTSLLSERELLTQYIGYMVYVDAKPLTRIRHCYLLSSNPLFGCVHQDKELLIPAHKHFIVSVDQTHQKIHMKLPEGLLDL